MVSFQHVGDWGPSPATTVCAVATASLSLSRPPPPPLPLPVCPILAPPEGWRRMGPSRLRQSPDPKPQIRAQVGWTMEEGVVSFQEVLPPRVVRRIRVVRRTLRQAGP